MSENLNERDRRVLQAVIMDYIQTAQPVGSRIVSKKYKIGLSPATIRNVMADLEEMGFFRVGEAWRALEGGELEVDGRLAVNPSGGMKARGPG